MADEFETWLHQLNEDFLASTTASLDIEAALAIVKGRVDSVERVKRRADSAEFFLAAIARDQNAVAATKPHRKERRGPVASRRRFQRAATAPPREEPVENVVRSPLSRRDARRRKRIRRDNDQALAWRVQDILIGCGLTRVDFSIGGGRTMHAPQVVSVSAGPPVRLTIRTLPGQTPDDFVRHAQAIAYNLGVAEVRVVAQGPSHIGLELLPAPD